VQCGDYGEPRVQVVSRHIPVVLGIPVVARQFPLIKLPSRLSRILVMIKKRRVQFFFGTKSTGSDLCLTRPHLLLDMINRMLFLRFFFLLFFFFFFFFFFK
jgi:hypothetical protein